MRSGRQGALALQVVPHCWTTVCVTTEFGRFTVAVFRTTPAGGVLVGMATS